MTKLTGTLALIGPTLIACGDNPGQPATRRDATEFVSAPRQIGSNVKLIPTIAFTSTRDNTERYPFRPSRILESVAELADELGS